MSTIKVSNVQHGSAAAAAITLDANGQATLNGLAYPTSGSLSGRNRIINGDMRIDQRNAGASVTPPITTITYSVDRWLGYQSAASKFSMQQNAGSVTPPVGFSHYRGITSLSAFSSAATDAFLTSQYIEGFNIADLAWGTANASPVTLSFWVRSSLTGTFGFSICNHDSTTNYVGTYAITSANAWEYKTITVPGPTTGTWLANNGIGIQLRFDLGSGSNFNGTAGVWSSSNQFRTSGSQSIVGTNGATWYQTGVQLEAGSVATPFERRLYGQELALCQRYAYFIYQTGTTGSIAGQGTATSATAAMIATKFPVTMRVAPTVTYSGMTITDSVNYNLSATSISSLYMNADYGRYVVNHSTGATQYRPGMFCTNGATDYVGFLAEL